MLLSARILTNLNGVNDFDYDTEMRFFEGDGPTIFLQLMDMSRDKAVDGFNPAGRRYVPAAGSVLSVTFDSIDDAKKVTRFAVQPYPSLDGSLWRVDLLPTDPVRGTVTLRLLLTEPAPATPKKAAISNVIKVVTDSNVQ